MADLKAAEPGLGAESQAPTIAPSRASLSEKESYRAEEARPSTEPTPQDAEATEAEKQNNLAKHATAASAAGQSIRATATREDGSEYPTGVKLGLITLALCLSVFLMALGMSKSLAWCLHRRL
jgi:hypothetical protein